ncbi:aldo/keto reductase [Gordonia otitidis]|uniref:aldo/keto reductase n=1 Tax=Gordonia otitidis TaxID=249058 RepID=UPI002355245E|nr:aldo/keto reductase [Gordonia otitidis]
MRYAHLGRSSVQVSRLVLGTMNFGSYANEQDAHMIMDLAFEGGINFFDTADVYGGAQGSGYTEEIIGRWLKKSGHRDNMFLATKVYGKMSADINDRGLSAFHIRRAAEESLRRLQVDHVDLYQLHHVDRATRWEEIWQAMDVLVTQGKITYVGSSNFAGWHIAQASESARARQSLGLITEQSHYNLLTRDIELEVIPAAQNYGMSVIGWSPLAGGALVGGDGVRRSTSPSDPATERQSAQWLQLCSEVGIAPSELALAWMLHRPGVHGPIIGPRTPDQLATAQTAVDVALDESLLARLDVLFPGPAAPAPEAYAW